jgi:hypothetical protein
MLTSFVSPLIHIMYHNISRQIKIINSPQLKLPLDPTKTPSVMLSHLSTPVETILIALTMAVLRKS